jgi:hypothetical protein
MNKLYLLSAGLVAAALFATPAQARDFSVVKRHAAKSANASVPLTARSTDHHLWTPALPPSAHSIQFPRTNQAAFAIVGITR